MQENENSLMTAAATPISILDLSAADRVLDLSCLTESQAAEIKMEVARKMIDLQTRKIELSQDTQALKFKLETMTEHTMKANDAGVSVTINHTQTDATGKTEIVMGNTQRAHKGSRIFGSLFTMIGAFAAAFVYLMPLA